jgi:hypothetical protein
MEGDVNMGINVIDNAALAKNISDGIAQLLADGLSLEGHLPGVVQAAVDAELTKVTVVLAPILDRIDTLNSTVTALIAESAHWRGDVERIFNLVSI